MDKNKLLELETPAYILRRDVLKNSMKSLQKALRTRFTKSIIGYSLKTNSMPFVLKEIKKLGGFAEVVSHDEYELARLCGFDINEIVYNGPLKSKKTFLEAIEGGAIVNIESKREIEWLSFLPSGKLFHVGIRVNIDLGAIAPDDAKENEDYSRFGFSEENGELTEALSKIATLKNVSVKGLHAHRTTASRATTTYKNIALYVGKLAEKHQLELSYIDIGGGFYGIMKDKPTFEEYSREIADGLSRFFDLQQLTVVVEPGNAIVASAFDFLSSVIDVKKVRDFYVVTTNGSRNDLDPFYKKSSYFKDILAANSDAANVEKQIVAGGTCLEYDKIFEIENEKLLSADDLILYRSVGAYTMTMSPLFIRFFPNVYLEDAGSYSLVRKRWAALDFFDIYDLNKIK